MSTRPGLTLASIAAWFSGAEAEPLPAALSCGWGTSLAAMPGERGEEPASWVSRAAVSPGAQGRGEHGGDHVAEGAPVPPRGERRRGRRRGRPPPAGAVAAVAGRGVPVLAEAAPVDLARAFPVPEGDHLLIGVIRLLPSRPRARRLSFSCIVLALDQTRVRPDRCCPQASTVVIQNPDRPLLRSCADALSPLRTAPARARRGWRTRGRVVRCGAKDAI